MAIPDNYINHFPSGKALRSTNPFPNLCKHRNRTQHKHFSPVTQNYSRVRSPNQPRSPVPAFLSLPIEIRIQIYDLLLVSRIHTAKREDARNYPIDINPELIALHSRTRVKRLCPTYPAIIRTCRQIHDEAVRVLYSRNTFRIGDTFMMRIFISWIGRNIRLIKSLDFWLEFDAGCCNEALFGILAREATGLRHVGVDCNQLERKGRWGSVGVDEGPGSDGGFVYYITLFPALRTVELRGQYPRDWPGFLRETLYPTVQVMESCKPYEELPPSPKRGNKQKKKDRKGRGKKTTK